MLVKRGGSTSESKTVLAEMLAVTSLSAQIGQGASEKTRNISSSQSALQRPRWQCTNLAVAAAEAGEEDVVARARTLQSEERDDYDEVWVIFRQSAVVSFEREVADGRKPEDVTTSYLEDAIAAEKSFETQLTGFSKGGKHDGTKSFSATR